MYEGWKKRCALSSEWVAETDAFVDHAFARSVTRTDVRCPCIKCRNIYFLDRRNISIDLCKNGYMLGYEVWVHHGEDPPPRIVWEVQSHDEGDYDTMEEVLDDVCHELVPIDFENPHHPPPPIMRILLRLRFRSSSSSLKLPKSHCMSTRKWSSLCS
jgi:hypothetical protein